MLKGKVWGSTETLYQSAVHHVERLVINPGGTCSWHFHRTKWNGFACISGTLIIEEDMSQHYGDVGGSYDLIDRTVLKPGDYMAVAPGVTHRFVNEGDSVVVCHEDYWPGELSGSDIARMGVGSVLETGT